MFRTIDDKEVILTTLLRSNNHKRYYELRNKCRGIIGLPYDFVFKKGQYYDGVRELWNMDREAFEIRKKFYDDKRNHRLKLHSTKNRLVRLYDDERYMKLKKDIHEYIFSVFLHRSYSWDIGTELRRYFCGKLGHIIVKKFPKEFTCERCNRYQVNFRKE